jgi:peptide deformylase
MCHGEKCLQNGGSVERGRRPVAAGCTFLRAGVPFLHFRAEGVVTISSQHWIDHLISAGIFPSRRAQSVQRFLLMGAKVVIKMADLRL